MNRIQWVLVGAATVLIVVLILLRQQKSSAPQQGADAPQTRETADVPALQPESPQPSVPAVPVRPRTPTPDETSRPEPTAPATPEPVEPVADEVPEPTVPPDTPAVLHGTVRHTNGQAVETWNSVWLLADGKEAIQVRAQEDGTFAAAGLAPGRYEAHPMIWSAESTPKTIMLEPGGELREDFVYRSLREIPVHLVTPGGKPFIAAMRGDKRDSWKWLEFDLAVIVTEQPPTSGPPPELGFGHSRFGLGKYTQGTRNESGDDRDGTLFVPERWPMYASVVLHSEVLATKKLTAPPESISFTLREEQIRSRLSAVTFKLAGDGPRSEIEDGFIMLLRNDRKNYDEHPFDREGDQITIRNKIPARYCLAVWFGEHAEDWSKIIDLKPGKTLDLGTVYLKKATNTPIQLRDGDGDPVARATILPMPHGVDYALHPSDLGRLTDKQGRLPFMHAPGRYFVAVETKDRVHFGVDLVAPPPVGEIHNLVVPPSHSLNLHLSGALREPVRINILAGEGRRVATWSTNVPMLRVLKFGEGDYIAEIIEGDGTKHRKTFQIRADRVPTLFFERAKAK